MSRFQFSVRSVFVAIAMIAAGAGAATASSNLVAFLALNGLAALFCSVAIFSAAMSFRAARAFWVGAAIPTALAAIFAVVNLYRASATFSVGIRGVADFAEPLRVVLPIVWCFAILNGGICAVIHWLVAA